VQNYSLEAVAPKFQEYFDKLLNLQSGKNWYYINKNRKNLDFLTIKHPHANRKN
jgi:hypothetical protein